MLTGNKHELLSQQARRILIRLRERIRIHLLLIEVFRIAGMRLEYLHRGSEFTLDGLKIVFNFYCVYLFSFRHFIDKIRHS